MGGGLMQLVAYGAQDIYLTGNPQITFFKVVYRRHTNFSMETIRQTLNGNADFNNKVSCTIARNGDLVYKIYLEHEIHLQTPATGQADHDKMDHLHMGCDYGSHVMKEYEIEIGGQQIDKHYGHWHSVYQQLTELNPTGGDPLTADQTTNIGHTLDSGSRSGVTLYNSMSGNGYGFECDGALFNKVDGWDGNSGSSLYRGWTVTERDNSDGGSRKNGSQSSFNGKFWIPLYFWFCRNPGLALPLIALQYHEVKINITFEDIGELMLLSNTTAAHDTVKRATNELARSGDPINPTNPTGVIDANGKKSFDLLVDYIYLDTDERRRFAQVSHEYLIEQLQFQNYSSKKKFNLNFNHPVKELIWTGTRVKISGLSDADLLTKFGVHPTTSHDHNLLARGVHEIKTGQPSGIQAHENGPVNGSQWVLKFNGHERFKKRDYRYFTRSQIWEHHTGRGGSYTESDSIAVYSFALKPEEHQPSGTCNFSRIDTAELIADNDTELNVYAVNYNVLRIMSGMGGLAYSN